MAITQTRPLLLLGSGYTGEALLAAAAAAGFTPIPTSRTPGGRTTADSTPWIRFDLRDESTWVNLPSALHCAWLFPAAPLEQVRKFAERFDLRSRRVAVVGTTSSYLPGQAGERGGERVAAGPSGNVADGTNEAMETGRGAQGIAQVDEDNPLDLTSDRVQGEEYLRSIGATVLRASGIYGPALGPHPARNPLSWLRRGMIASADSWVNLVHVSDLASAILEALNRDLGGDQLIVSDGTPRRWGDIADWAVGKGLVEEVRYAGAGGRPSKRLSNARLISRAGHVIAHPDLFAELQAIEGRGGSEGASRGR